MADAAKISMVQDLLPPESGWDDTKVGTYLDAGLTVYGVMTQFWEAKTAQTANMIDISESGSSRSLSQIHQNAKAQAEYWRDKAATEKADEKAELEEADSHIKIHKISRI